jgi:hypothetical protein
MDGEVAILDNDLGPQLRIECLPIDQATLCFEQHAQDVECLARHGQALAAPGQTSFGSIEKEWAELIQRHANLPLRPRPLTFF